MSVSPDFVMELIVTAGQFLYKVMKSKIDKTKKLEESKNSELEAINLTDEYVGGSLGDKLLQGLREYKETGNMELLKEIKKEKLTDIFFILEVARKISMDVQLRFNIKPHYTITFNRSLEPKQITYIALFTYNIMRIANALHNGPVIHLFMSAPATLAFQLGQLVGIDTMKIQLYQYTGGKYMKIPIMRRRKT